jgi:Fur family ferric uptake transcriptional regulator
MGVIRRTKSVSRVLSFFQSGHEAMSVVDLVNRLKTEMNKTTVYRILERLEDEGIIHSFSGNNGLRWYAKCHDCTHEHHNDLHPHFECKDCGKVECLDISMELPKLNNRHIESAEVMLRGQCADCKEK